MIGTEVELRRVGDLVWVNGPVVRARGSSTRSRCMRWSRWALSIWWVR